MKRRMFFAPALIALLLFPCIVFSQEYYADVEIVVDETGIATISGITNHPELQPRSTSEYTSKKGEFWLLNITIEGVFSDFVYEIMFPETAEINYLSVPNGLSISNRDGHVSVSGTGTDEQFFLVVQYTIGEKNAIDFYAIALFIVAGSAVISILIFIRGRKAGKIIHQIPDFNVNALTSRQRQILDIVMKSRGGITQAEIQKITSIPKASLSRNINALLRKGILSKDEKGMTNFIYLRKGPKK